MPKPNRFEKQTEVAAFSSLGGSINKHTAINYRGVTGKGTSLRIGSLAVMHKTLVTLQGRPKLPIL
jgi:hypothetical protein